MPLQFKETAPGVNIAAWQHPKTCQHRTVAIIASCDAWQLYIDCELAADDLASFDAATKEAIRRLGAKPLSLILRITGVLLLAAVAGATTISATKIIANNGNPTLTKTLPKSAMKTGRGKLKKSQTRSHRRKRAKRLGLVRLKTQAGEPLPVPRPRPRSRPIAKPIIQ